MPFPLPVLAVGVGAVALGSGFVAARGAKRLGRWVRKRRADAAASRKLTLEPWVLSVLFSHAARLLGLNEPVELVLDESQTCLAALEGQSVVVNPDILVDCLNQAPVESDTGRAIIIAVFARELARLRLERSVPSSLKQRSASLGGATTTPMWLAGWTLGKGGFEAHDAHSAIDALAMSPLGIQQTTDGDAGQFLDGHSAGILE